MITLFYVLCVHDVIILWKMASAQKDSRFYVPPKTIHNQAKYIVMDYHDREAK